MPRRVSRAAGRPTLRAGRLVASLLLLSACSRTPPPNVVIVTFDTVRYDRFGCTGDARARTPTVDALAARGLIFDHAYASAPLTLPSHTTMMTGLEPFTHGVRNNGHFWVPDKVVTLAETLKAAGYRTAAFVSAEVLEARYKLNRGFDVYDDRTNPEGGVLFGGVTKRRGDQTTRAAIAWLEKQGDGAHPFFLWVHYFDAHKPYQLPAQYDRMADGYAAAISFADAELGRLLEKVAGVEGERGTLVVFTADHGESLGEHGEFTHGIVAYDATLHVPLVVAGPGVPENLRRSGLVGHIDITPTVLEAAGLRVPRELPGRSLVRAAHEDAADDETVVRYFESEGGRDLFGWQGIAGVRTARWKYTAEPSPPELYDVASDPQELRNLADSEPDVRAKMEARWSVFRRAREHPEPDATIKNVPPEVEERLAALGYVSVPQKTFPNGEAPDPRKFVTMTHLVSRAKSLATTGHYDEAIAQLEAMSQSPSVRALVLRSLAQVYTAAGRFDEAIRTHRAYLDLADTEQQRLELARTLIKAKRPAEAVALLESHDYADVRTSALLRARALIRLGRQSEARTLVDKSFTGIERLERLAWMVLEVSPQPDGEGELRKLLSEAPQDATLKSDLGYYLALWGRSEQGEEARDLLTSASRAHPDDPDLRSNHGWGAYRLGRDDEAIEELTAALRIERKRQRDRFRLAFPLVRKGETAAAIAALRETVGVAPGTRWAREAPKLIALLEKSPRELKETPQSLLDRFEVAGD